MSLPFKAPVRGPWCRSLRTSLHPYPPPRSRAAQGLMSWRTGELPRPETVQRPSPKCGPEPGSSHKRARDRCPVSCARRAPRPPGLQGRPRGRVSTPGALRLGRGPSSHNVPRRDGDFHSKGAAAGTALWRAASVRVAEAPETGPREESGGRELRREGDPAVPRPARARGSRARAEAPAGLSLRPHRRAL